jgi:large subunit ribosomal protein L5
MNKDMSLSSDSSRLSRLEKYYRDFVKHNLKKSLNLSNIMEVPKLSKIVLNIGAKDAVADSRVLNVIMQTLDNITGQKSVRTFAKKSIAGFKIREGMAIGVMVTLRRRKMYEFFDKLVNLALPKVRDFQGVSKKLDGKGNYNLGIKDWVIFPEVDSNQEKTFGLNITVVTSAKNDVHAYELLKSLGMPFKKR